MSNRTWRDERTEKEIQKAEELLAKLEYKERDTLYRLLWAESVRENVESVLEGSAGEWTREFSDEDYEDIVSDIADQYVSGNYDCNLNYWDNLDNLIQEKKKEYSKYTVSFNITAQLVIANDSQKDADDYVSEYADFGPLDMKNFELIDSGRDASGYKFFYLVEGSFEVEVLATDEQNAKKAAEKIFRGTDFGELQDVSSSIELIEPEGREEEREL